MTPRQRFLDYVKNGGTPVCSPQIGGGAGFDSKLVGKEWLHETTLEDTLAAVERFDIVPLIPVGLADLGDCDSKLAWRRTHSETSDGLLTQEFVLETPKGTLVKRTADKKFASGFQTKYPIQDTAELDILEYYIDRAIVADLTPIVQHTRSVISTVADRAAVCIQWATQPYELLCFPNTVDTVLLAQDAPEQFARLMDKIFILDQRLMDAIARGGADFIFLGGPGSEMISPRYYEEYLIPYSQRVSDYAHSVGLHVYSHICSPIEPFLTKGFYNRMGIDLFETLSPPPMGNVTSLADAMTRIDPSICTRGNVGLDLLLNGTPDTIRQATFEVLRQTRGRKHMVAASDYLFYETPEANVRAMASAVAEFNAARM
jgi:hypothetical protein